MYDGLSRFCYNGRMDRRHFVRTVILGFGAARLFGQGHQPPINCAPPSHGAPKHITFDTKVPVMPRKSVWDLNSGELARLNAAYQELRNLYTKNPNDPRGWMQQANVHCFNCSGGYDPSNVEIHGSWWFLPWHRCYLHVHERILGKLIGDPTFRLAYWDWDTYPTHAILPPPFVPQGPLFDQFRGASATDVIPSDITGQVAMQTVLGTQSTAGFMGQLSDPPNNQYFPGALENSPHGPVHIWTGDANPGGSPEPTGCYYPTSDPAGPVVDQSPNCLDMGVLSNAAQDPIFFAHHSNIDRLWDVWLGMPGSQGNPKDTSWKDQKFSFFDENGDWVYITIADVLTSNEQANLRYTYQAPSNAGAAKSPAPKSSKTALKAVKPLVIASAPEAIAVGTKPHVQSVAVPLEHQQNLKILATSGKNPGAHYVLHIDGLTLPPNEGVIVHVFADEPNASRETKLGASFVGTFSVVPTGHRDHNHPIVRNASFELRPATAALIAAQKSLTVTLVPKLANGAEPKKSNLTYKRIYLSVE